MEHGYHIPVLQRESAKYLLVSPDGVYLDATLGGAGHSKFFLNQLSPKAFLVGLDADRDALETAREKLGQYPNILLRQIYYDQLDIVLFEADIDLISGAFFDLGVSSFQLDAAHRGFSFQQDAPLDMRMDQGQSLSAREILHHESEERLGTIIREFGEERHWRAIARDLIVAREAGHLETTSDLAAVVSAIIGKKHLSKSLARVFQAIRIAVNNELERLSSALEKSFKALMPGGRLVVISYHSLEDRIVKNFMREKQQDCVCPPEFPTCICQKEKEGIILTRKPVLPREEEVDSNPRARSAKLRALEKL